MQKTKIAVIGCGKQAPKHISGLRNIPSVEVTVADLDQALARELADREGVGFYPDVAAVFDDDTVDAVSICTPTSSHCDLIEKSVASGKNFLCEKPLCESLDEARYLEKLVEGSGRIGMVGYIYRFAPIFEEAKRLAGDGQESLVLGNLSVAHLRLGGRGSHQVWKHRKETSGGAVNEMLVHMIDLALWFFGPPEHVQVHACALLRPEREIQGARVEVDAEDYVLVEMVFPGGLRAFCQADLVTPAFTQFVEMQGDHGSFMGSIQPDMPSFVFAQTAVGGFESGKHALQFGPRNLFEAQMAEFVRSVRTGSQPERNTIGDSVRLMEVLDKVQQETMV